MNQQKRRLTTATSTTTINSNENQQQQINNNQIPSLTVDLQNIDLTFKSFLAFASSKSVNHQFCQAITMNDMINNHEDDEDDDLNIAANACAQTTTLSNLIEGDQQDQAEEQENVDQDEAKEQENVDQDDAKEQKNVDQDEAQEQEQEQEQENVDDDNNNNNITFYNDNPHKWSVVNPLPLQLLTALTMNAMAATFNKFKLKN